VLILAFATSWVYIGNLLKLKYALGTLECAYLSFYKCPTTMQMPNICLYAHPRGRRYIYICLYAQPWGRRYICIFVFMPTPGGGDKYLSLCPPLGEEIYICLYAHLWGRRYLYFLYAHPWGRNMYLSLCPPLGEEYVFVLISGPKYYEDKVSGAREMFYVLV
jgi:hypothetical protein